MNEKRKKKIFTLSSWLSHEGAERDHLKSGLTPWEARGRVAGNLRRQFAPSDRRCRSFRPLLFEAAEPPFWSSVQISLHLAVPSDLGVPFLLFSLGPAGTRSFHRRIRLIWGPQFCFFFMSVAKKKRRTFERIDGAALFFFFFFLNGAVGPACHCPPAPFITCCFHRSAAAKAAERPRVPLLS